MIISITASFSEGATLLLSFDDDAEDGLGNFLQSFCLCVCLAVCVRVCVSYLK